MLVIVAHVVVVVAVLFVVVAVVIGVSCGLCGACGFQLARSSAHVTQSRPTRMQRAQGGRWRRKEWEEG